jgi:hypothetical protein
MDRPDLHTKAWRDLPRDGDCVASFVFDDAVGPCHGLIHRHHVRPGDPGSRTYQVCARHHPMVEAFLRQLRDRADRVTGYRRCPHPPGTHRYPGAREACERRLNRRVDREPVAA